MTAQNCQNKGKKKKGKGKQQKNKKKEFKKKMQAEEIKLYIEIGGAIIFAIATIIFLFKMLIKKRDTNGNGKIEKEELTDADITFMKEMLKESILTIAKGMLNLNGITGKEGYNILLNEVKQSKKVFEEIEKEEKPNEKNS